MEIKSAVFGGTAVLFAGGLVFGLVSTANAENAPEPTVTTTTVAPPATPTQEPPVSAPSPEPTASSPGAVAPPAPAVAPAPVITAKGSTSSAPAIVVPGPVVQTDAPAPIEPRPLETYMPGITVSGSGDGRVNAPADPGDIKNVHRVPMPEPTH